MRNKAVGTLGVGEGLAVEVLVGASVRVMVGDAAMSGLEGIIVVAGLLVGMP